MVCCSFCGNGISSRHGHVSRPLLVCVLGLYNRTHTLDGTNHPRATSAVLWLRSACWTPFESHCKLSLGVLEKGPPTPSVGLKGSSVCFMRVSWDSLHSIYHHNLNITRRDLPLCVQSHKPSVSAGGGGGDGDDAVCARIPRPKPLQAW